MPNYNSYVICTSPRSGSTLLCKLLAETGVAGNPDSYFHRTSLEDWLTDLDVTPEEAATPRDVLAEVFRAAIGQGRDGGDLFGLRLQRHSFQFLLEKLAVLHPGDFSDVERFRLSFGSTLFIHLSRPDKVAQAVSYMKADQTGLWHVAPNGAELEQLAPHREPVYNGDELKSCVEMMTAYDRQWEGWFASEGIDPLRISYEDLSSDPAGTLRNILEQLGLDPSKADGIEPGVRKLADDINQDWIAQFNREPDAN